MLKKQKNLLFKYCNRYQKRRTAKTSFIQAQSLTYYISSRSFATNFEDRNSEKDKISWPEVTSLNGIPTPYEIFNQQTTSPYSKQRFYELVKLYHPDRYDLEPALTGLSNETKLERYRLVVAANNILCDPIRRSAYDRYGTGWYGRPEICRREHSAHASNINSARKWKGGFEDLSRNATWEDWERWYSRDEPQHPKYTSNATFVGLILSFALIGGIGQATRAGNQSFNYMEQRNALHDKVSMELREIRKESAQCNFQEERIHKFIKNREFNRYATDYRELSPKSNFKNLADNH